MDFQLQSIPTTTASSPFTRKLHYGPDRPPAAADPDQNTRVSPFCAICLSDVGGGDKYRSLPGCGHCFHAQCVGAWLESHSRCPLCRSEVPRIIRRYENRCQLGALLSYVLLLFRSFLEKALDPLNGDLKRILSDNVKCSF